MVSFCFVLFTLISSAVDQCVTFTRILQGYFTGTGATTWLLQWQWTSPELVSNHNIPMKSHEHQGISIYHQLFIQQLSKANEKQKNQSSALQTLYAENPPVSSWFPTQRASNLLNHVMSCHDHSTKHNKSPTLSIFLLMYSMSYCHSLWKVHQWPVDSPHKGPVMWKLSCCDIIIHKPETQSIFLGMYSMSYCHSLWKVHLWWSGNQQCGCWHYESHYNRMQHMIWWGLLHVTWQVGFHGDSSQLGLRPHLANDFSITIQTSFFQIPTKWSLQNFAHAMTVVLSWHVQNFVVIWWPRMELQQNEISPEMHCDGTIVKWDRLQTLLHWQLKCYALKNSAFISTFWAAFINA